MEAKTIKAKQRIHLFIESQTLKKVREIAAKEHRTISGQITLLIEQALKNKNN
jgi:hypothetical protein